MNGSLLIYERLTSDLRMIHFWFTNDSLLIYEWLTSDLWTTHFWSTNDSPLIYKWLTFDLQMTHFWFLNDSPLIYKWLTSDLRTTYFWFKNESVLIWTAAYIAWRYPRKVFLFAFIHGHACWFHNELVSKSLQLSFSYPRKCLFNIQRRFASRETCLPTRFLETGVHVAVYFLMKWGT
jgi:hypothetical protein